MTDDEKHEEWRRLARKAWFIEVWEDGKARYLAEQGAYDNWRHPQNEGFWSAPEICEGDG